MSLEFLLQQVKIIENLPADIFLLDTELRYIYANKNHCDAIGKSEDKAIGMHSAEILPSDWSLPLIPAFHKALQGEVTDTFFSVALQEGDEIYFRSIALPVTIGNSEILGVLALVFDKTDQGLAIHHLNELKMALNAHAIVAVTNAKGIITQVNEKFCAISQFSESELLGNTHNIVNSGFHSKDFFRDLWRTISKGVVWNGEICNRAKDGSIYWVHTTIVPFVDSDGKPLQYISIRADITQRKLAEQKIERMAFYDALTDLPNRRLMMERLLLTVASCKQSGKHGALILIDLDHFKEVNDTIGYTFGDELLRSVGNKILQCVRDKSCVSRIGGDEFVLILSDLSEDATEANIQAQVVADRICRELDRSHCIKERCIASSASIGLVVFQDVSEDHSELLQKASMALHQAKISGKNRVHYFTSSLQEEALASALLLADLRQAIAQRELSLYYQPVVDKNRRTLGFEALVRWAHPARGMVSPGDFIPIAEQAGLILDIGQWVLDTACRQLRAWSGSSATSGFTLSVNISAAQLRERDFVGNVLRSIEQAGANPKRLILELTESMFHSDVSETIAKMRALGRVGVRFAMDDFGTGYSSLSYLKQLPLNSLKIDRSFIQNVLDDANDAAISRTILALAKTLELQVIAEGVETTGQFNFLIAHGCDAFQGYLFGRPTSTPLPLLLSDH